MNTTLAPMDKINQDTLEEVRRQVEPRDELVARHRERDLERDGRENKRDDDSDDEGGGSSSTNDGRPIGSKKGQQNHDVDDEPSTTQPTFRATLVPTVTSTTTAPSILLTLTPATGSPRIATSSSLITSSIIATLTPATTSAATPTSTPTNFFTLVPDTSNQPRKGFNTDDPSHSSITSTNTDDNSSFTRRTTSQISSSSTATVALQSELSTPSPTVTSGGGFGFPFSGDGTHPQFPPPFGPAGVSPVAENLLIAFGSFGAFVLVSLGVYYFFRLRKSSQGSVKDYPSNRTPRKGGDSSWYGWLKQNQDYVTDEPPQYFGNGRDEKPQPSAFTNEIYVSDEKVAANSSAARRNSGASREGLLDNAAPIEKTPAEMPVKRTATESFYNISKPTGVPTQQASNLQEDTRTENTYLSRQASGSNYANAGTYPTRQNSNAYDASKGNPNHMSYLSSISSGFGDGLMIPDPTVVGNERRQIIRQSQIAQDPRFSWVPSQPRDTIYTNSSVDTAPRFRTVNSWVAQQTGRVERQIHNTGEVPAMPAVPVPLQAGVAKIVNVPRAPMHQRYPSSDPRFNFHPGAEVQISRGSRVPSETLDREVGGNVRLSRELDQ